MYEHTICDYSCAHAMLFFEQKKTGGQDKWEKYLTSWRATLADEAKPGVSDPSFLKLSIVLRNRRAQFLEPPKAARFVNGFKGFQARATFDPYHPRNVHSDNGSRPHMKMPLCSMEYFADRTLTN